jgi:cell volume regulation protein A
VLSKTSFKFGVPVLILFLGVGVIAGSEGLGIIGFENYEVTRFLGSIALCFILFSGGLDTQITSIKSVWGRGLMLSTVGVLITAILTGFFVSMVTDLWIYEGLLLGAIVASTDAAAVFSILRAKNLGLKGYLRPTLELESGSNDPMAFFLVIAFLQLALSDGNLAFSEFIILFVKQMSIGALVGVTMGKFMLYSINKLKLDVEGLYPVMVTSMVLFTFSFADLFEGNGFLAIYIAGVLLGNEKFIHKKSLLKFFDGQAWLMQVVLFLVLGLLVFPSELIPVAPQGILISIFLIFVARPIAVFISLIPYKIKFRNKLFISWVGLKGAVPIVFATFPLISGFENGKLIFNLVFFVTLISLMLQGTTLGIMAKWLHVFLPEKAKKKQELDIQLSDFSGSELIEVVLSSASPYINKSLIEIDLSSKLQILIILRNGKIVIPKGDTILQENDKITLASKNTELLEKEKQKFESKTILTT